VERTSSHLGSFLGLVGGDFEREHVEVVEIPGVSAANESSRLSSACFDYDLAFPSVSID
jgi:hypothetical protein